MVVAGNRKRDRGRLASLARIGVAKGVVAILVLVLLLVLCVGRRFRLTARTFQTQHSANKQQDRIPRRSWNLRGPLLRRKRKFTAVDGTCETYHHRKSVDLSITSSAFFLDKASRPCEQKAGAVLVIV
jgi:hypothetical protein